MNLITLINRIVVTQAFKIIKCESGEILFYGYVTNFDVLQSCIDYDFRKCIVKQIYCINDTINILVEDCYNV